MLLGGDAKEKPMKCYFFGLTGSQDVQDGQYLTFETDLAAFEAARWLAARLSSKHPELRGNTSVVATRKDKGETYYVSL
jgi:hypothetical protein